MKKVLILLGFFMLFQSPMFATELPKDMELKLLISEKQIQERIKITAKDLANAYKGKEIVMVALLRGSILFVADLLRELPADMVSLETVRCQSYDGMERKELKIQGLENVQITGKNVVVVDDIFDSGKTLSEVMKLLKEKKPASIESVVLLYKKTAKRETNIYPDRYLFAIEDFFVIGYGLDYNNSYRGLREIFYLQ